MSGSNQSSISIDVSPGSNRAKQKVMITFNGRTMCLLSWAKELGLHHSSLLTRLRTWPLERAMTETKLACSVPRTWKRINNHFITFNGETLCIADWARRTGLSRPAIRDRFNKGYPIDKVLAPVAKRIKHERHGAARSGKLTPEYRSWSSMRNRCLNSKHKDYHRYGGRGISVCQRWLDSYKNFLADMGSRPSPKHSIDRIDNNGNYEPGNCRWATTKEQNQNTRINNNITYEGKTLCLSEWSRVLGIDRATLWVRLKTMSVEKAFSTPVKKCRR